MFISRLYCKGRDKGYLNEYERYETQPIRLPSADRRTVPFKAYKICERGDTQYNTVYMNPSNTFAPNVWISEITSIVYRITKLDGTLIKTGISHILQDATFNIVFEDLEKGYYELSVTISTDTSSYTKKYPLYIT